MLKLENDFTAEFQISKCDKMFPVHYNDADECMDYRFISICLGPVSIKQSIN